MQLDCPLESLPKLGTITGHLTRRRVARSGRERADQGERLGRQGAPLRRPTGRARSSSTRSPRQRCSLAADADGYLAVVAVGQVKARAVSDIELSAVKKPKNPLVEVTAGEIRIKQQIQFAVDSATILPESFGLMTEIADTLLRNPRIRRVEIQGHTDNSGSADHNKLLERPARELGPRLAHRPTASAATA